MQWTDWCCSSPEATNTSVTVTAVTVFLSAQSGTFRNPQPMVFSQKYRRYKWEAYCGTNGRRTAVQIGGVLRRFPFSKALKPARHSVTNGGRTAVQIGGVPPVLFRQVVWVGGS